MATWRTLLTEAFASHGDAWENAVSCTMSEADLDREFDNGYGRPEGGAFTLWTIDRVYFPACYDGMEWVASDRKSVV